MNRFLKTLILVILAVVLVGCTSGDVVVEETAVPTSAPTTVAVDEPVEPVDEPTVSVSEPVETIEEVVDSTEESVEETVHEGEANRLIDEKSPYLLQHAYNPVDWYAWGEEAFARAAAEDKPIFLSIGYSTCHWCHVMEHESFEDEEVAALMNDVFVSVKVDREERPDIDGIYMNVAQLAGNRGGWPLTIIMTPDQKPFYVATYIPKEERFGRPGMMEIIPQVDAAWQNERAQLIDYANRIVEALQPDEVGDAGTMFFTADQVLGAETLDLAFGQLWGRFDATHGGFGSAPKFPSPHNMLFLLRHGARTGNEQTLEMVETTLQAMRRGGVYDQIGYGFHRYSTDERWKLPHFEKMLYDQAMLAMAYTETYQVTEDGQYQEVAREIFTYILRDMTDVTGGFYSAEDADSEGEEGIFYIWEVAEIEALLSPEDAELVITMARMSEEGNFLEEATGEALGENIIYWDSSYEGTAAMLNMTEDEMQARFDVIREQLFEVREERIHPSKDDKILTDWNGLMIAAMAKAGQAFDEPLYTDAAVKSADFIMETMRGEDGRLLHRYRDGEAGLQASVDDYAFLTWGLLELYEATFDLRYLEEAIALTAELETYFWDDQGGGFYFTPYDGETLIARQKKIYDGAIPSGNSAAMLNLLRLGRITADATYEARAYQLSQAFRSTLEQNPTAYSQLMSGLEFGVGNSYEVIIVGEDGADDTAAMIDALQTVYVPNKVVLLRGFDDDAPLTQLADYTKYYYPIDDAATAYVCQNYICEFPTTDPGEMVMLLQGSSSEE